MIKYLGSKRLLLPHIEGLFADLESGSSVLDLFSGTSRVAQALKRQGLFVTANDHNTYAHTIARCYIGADGAALENEATRLIDTLRDTAPSPGWFTQQYCEESRFFHPDNGGHIEAIRQRIETMDLDEPLRSIALVSLMEAADRVDSTTGLQMAYLKKWAPRASQPLKLRVPELIDGPGHATGLDALEGAQGFTGDAAYLDPPYNQHSYRSNYHIWETLGRWDDPEVYGVARKRMDCRTVKSDFNSKPRIGPAMEAVVQALDVRRVVVSFNNEGYLGLDQLESMLSKRGTVHRIEIPHRRYVGAQIGIHNPSGDKVGAVSHLHNKELLYLVDEDPDHGARIARSVREAS